MAKAKSMPIQKPFRVKPLKVKRIAFKMPKLPKISVKKMMV
jgi:hypothetical protein